MKKNSTKHALQSKVNTNYAHMLTIRSKIAHTTECNNKVIFFL
jgi:hypothetical protein